MLGLTLVVVDVPRLHQHRDPGLAWYDAECPSLRLAVAGSDPGMLPVVDTGQAVPPVDMVVPVAPSERHRPSLRSPGSRAPPTPA
jgi:hypothetical protein